MNRRSMLTSIGTVGTVAIAGCTEQGEAEFEVQDYEIPEDGKVGESVEISITFENVGDGDGTLDEQAYISPSNTVETNFETAPNINLEISAGETATWNHSFTAENSGRVSFSYDDIEQDILIEPASKAPRIQRVELITEWNSFGDVADNAIESTTVGSNAAIGIRYDYWHEDGTHAITAQAVIRDENGERYDILQDSAERLTESEGWGNWEWYLPFSTEGASTGEYEATVQIRDDESEETSEAVSTAFTIEE